MSPESLSNSVFSNSSLLERILKAVVGSSDFEENSGSVMDGLELRLVNQNFNASILHLVRQEHKEIVISPLPIPEAPEDVNDKENLEDSEDTRGFYMNGRRILMECTFAHFTFLNFRAEIRIRSLRFEGFEEEDEEVHDVIMYDLMASQEKLHTFLGSNTICPIGCPACSDLIRNPSTLYSELHPDLEFPEFKHFKSLKITERFLTDVAWKCFSSKNFDDTLEKSINSNVSCDLLEITVSDLVMVTVEEDQNPEDEDVRSQILKPSILPRQLLERILILWKVKKVKINFITGFSTQDQPTPWKCSKLTPFSFSEDFRKIQKTSHLLLDSVEINLWKAKAFAKSFAYSMVGRSHEDPHPGFQNLIPNVLKIFPTRKVMICMPMKLKTLVLPRFVQVLDGLKGFTWTDPLNCRRAQFYFRFISDDWRGSMGRAKTQSRFQNRPIHMRVFQSSSTFDSWPLPKLDDLDPDNSEHPTLVKLRILSLVDSENLSAIHIQVLKIRKKVSGILEDPRSQNGEAQKRQNDREGDDESKRARIE